MLFLGLLWPTTLMGMSLPFLAKAIVRRIDRSATAIGWLYGLNTIGAGLGALLAGLKEDGLLAETLVVAMGEFGRTPKINANGGRDHWPNVSCAMLAGGGLRTGQVIGATDRLAGEAADRPIKFAEVFATLYHQLGIDTAQTTINDLHGRPQAGEVPIEKGPTWAARVRAVPEGGTGAVVVAAKGDHLAREQVEPLLLFGQCKK